MPRSREKKRAFTIEIQPIGRRVEIPSGKTLLDAAQAAGAGLISLCGGEGWCFRCRVRLISGEVNQLTDNELDALNDQELASGYRLACQVLPESDLAIIIPMNSLSTPQRLQIDSFDNQVLLDPVVKIIDLEISPPSLRDLEPDANRVRRVLHGAGFQDVEINFPVLVNLSDTLRKNGWKCRFILREKEVIALLPLQSEIFGLAIDIGTTKIAMYLLSLESGQVVEKAGETNPQIAFGEDIISRIAYASRNENGRGILQEMVIGLLNEKITEMCVSSGISPEQIVDAVVVGNTAMHHLFAGLPVSQLATTPFVPAASEALDFHAARIGLHIASGACVHMLPVIAGYIGADHSAVLLAAKLWNTDRTVAVIDIGTNTEITLAVQGRFLSCSCASGPAFEGAHVRHGMRAAEGAIEHVQIAGEREVRWFTIGDRAPVGICGSGILDAVAEMKAAQVINEKGAFIARESHSRSGKKALQEFVLAEAGKTGHGRDITITRQDVSEVQLAKAAIRGGLEVLFSLAGVIAQDLDEILIAGAFGSYIDIGNAIKIGMLPDLPLERFHQIGNAAGQGARLALLSSEQRSIIEEFARQIEYIELTTIPLFQTEFIKAILL